MNAHEHSPSKSVLIHKEISALVAELFNNLPVEALKGVPPAIAHRIGDLMVDNGYRIVFNRWYLQAEPRAAEPPDTAPTAWMRGYVSHNGPSGPDEYDVECVYGDDPPDDSGKWTPLYRRPPSPPSDALALAIRFHETYERLAPSFGYETRQDTRAFDPQSKNGRLMVAVCAELGAAVTKEAGHE